MTIDEAVQAWKAWAVTADTSEEGWETDFPRWDELRGACEAAMLASELSPGVLEQVGFCWQISEEGEEFAEFARERLAEVRSVVIALAAHESPAVRWQAYDVLGGVADAGEIVRRGVRDVDAYVRRRALLACARDPARIDDGLITEALADRDPLVRRCVWEVASRSGSEGLVQRVRGALLADGEEIVREVVRRAPLG